MSGEIDLLQIYFKHLIFKIACPYELYSSTGIHRWDEKNKEYACEYKEPIVGGYLHTFMDCGKPSYAWKNNIPK